MPDLSSASTDRPLPTTVAVSAGKLSSLVTGAVLPSRDKIAFAITLRALSRHRAFSAQLLPLAILTSDRTNSIARPTNPGPIASIPAESAGHRAGCEIIAS